MYHPLEVITYLVFRYQQCMLHLSCKLFRIFVQLPREEIKDYI